jgi:hypothetical protein
VRIVAAEGAVANKQGADLAHHVVDGRVRAEVRRHPGRVAARAGDEAVERHGG